MPAKLDRAIGGMNHIYFRVHCQMHSLQNVLVHNDHVKSLISGKLTSKLAT